METRALRIVLQRAIRAVHLSSPLVLFLITHQWISDVNDILLLCISICGRSMHSYRKTWLALPILEEINCTSTGDSFECHSGLLAVCESGSVSRGPDSWTPHVPTLLLCKGCLAFVLLSGIEEKKRKEKKASFFVAYNVCPVKCAQPLQQRVHLTDVQ